MTAGYGKCMSCRGRLATGRRVSGVALLTDSIVRRLSTPRGTLDGGDEESTYGLDLAGYVGAVGDVIAEAALPAIIENELLKDERIAAVSVVVTRSTSSPSPGLVVFWPRLRVTPANEAETFTLTLAVSSVTVEIIGGIPS